MGSEQSLMGFFSCSPGDTALGPKEPDATGAGGSLGGQKGNLFTEAKIPSTVNPLQTRNHTTEPTNSQFVISCIPKSCSGSDKAHLK